MARNRRFVTVLIGWAGFSLFFAAWLQFQWGGGEVTQRFDNLGETLAAFVAAAVCGIAAWRHQQRTRIAWALIGASALFWGVGQAIWSYYELIVGQQVPFPSFADLGFLGAVPLAVVGVLFFPWVPTRATSLLRTILDAILTAGSLFIISWATVLGTVSRTGSGGLIALAAVVAVFEEALPGQLDPVVFWSVMVLIVGVVLRQYLMRPCEPRRRISSAGGRPRPMPSTSSSWRARTCARKFASARPAT